MNLVLNQNKSSWDAMADTWFGSTALPVYGGVWRRQRMNCICFLICPAKSSGYRLRQRPFPALVRDKRGRRALGAGSVGEANLQCTKLSDRKGYHPRLYNAPMEQECGLPKEYFDVVYSIYAIGWTTDLKAAFCNIASYLKPGGVFIFHGIIR